VHLASDQGGPIQVRLNSSTLISAVGTVNGSASQTGSDFVTTALPHGMWGRSGLVTLYTFSVLLTPTYAADRRILLTLDAKHKVTAVYNTIAGHGPTVYLYAMTLSDVFPEVGA